MGELRTISPDADIESADWTKQSWDLPPYKSAEFMKQHPSLTKFRRLPVYKHAVANRLIVDDEWVGETSASCAPGNCEAAARRVNKRLEDLESEGFDTRMRAAVSLAWRLFARKVGDRLIPVHKEASMQLQYAYVLQQLLPLLSFHPKEEFRIELESGVKLDGHGNEIDVLLTGSDGKREHRIAIEMKCYRTFAASGKRRGATDIFKKDVFEDLQITERYVAACKADEGIVLVMTDLEHFVAPKWQGDAKSADYNISHGRQFGPGVWTTPIGGKAVRVELTRSYFLDWNCQGDFWFLEVQGEPAPLDE